MDITIIRGDDITLEITFTDNDGNAIDLTGSTVYFTVKSNLDDVDGDAIISKDVTSFNNPTTGIMELSLTNSDTDVEVGNYYFDVQLKKGGEITSSNKGRFRVVRDITIRTS